LLSGGAYTTLDPPGSIEAKAEGINDAGQVVGVYFDSAARQHGFLFSEGSYTTIDLPGSSASYAYGLNNSGQIVGMYVEGHSANGFLATPTPEPSALVLLAVGALASICWAWRRQQGSEKGHVEQRDSTCPFTR